MNPSGGLSPLTDTHRKYLLTVLREAVAYYLKNKELPEFTATDDPVLRAPKAVYVTLKQSGQLRGCIGTPKARWPLEEAVQHEGIAAATKDPRFPVLLPEELPSVEFEISILSELKRIRDAALVEPGRHGVMLVQGGRAGLLLPQVWETTGWTRDQFLTELARQKAYLSPHAWKDPETELYVFTAEVFGEQ